MKIKQEWIGTPMCEVKYGDVVQINPLADQIFGGSFIFVQEARKWGCIGFIQIPGRGRSYVRRKWEEVDYIGQAVWRPTTEDVF